MPIGDPGSGQAPPGVVALREPAHLVSPRARVMWFVGGVAQALVLAAAQALWWLVDAEGPRAPHVVLAAAFVVPALAYVVVMPQWRYRVHRGSPRSGGSPPSAGSRPWT